MIAAIRKFLTWLFGRPTPTPVSISEPVDVAPYRLHIPRSLVHELREATRPNARRGEPLAFLRVRFASEDSRTVLVAVGALQFPDEAYVLGPAGANFSTDWAVGVANQQIGANVGLLLVHSHGGDGVPAFSGTDHRTNRCVMGALAFGVDTAPYGALVLSDTDGRSVVAADRSMIEAKVVVVPDRFSEPRVSA
jgi:hypothetical protein